MALSDRVVSDEVAVPSTDIIFTDLFQDKRGQEIKIEEDTTSASIYIATFTPQGELEEKKESIKTIEQQKAFQWTETIIIAEDLSEKLNKQFSTSPDHPAVPLATEVVSSFEKSKEVREKIALLDMGDLGYATLSRTTITEEDVLLYAGALKNFGNAKIIEYGFKTQAVCLEKIMYSRQTETIYNVIPCVIDAQYTGNLSRFLSHLPSEQELKDCKLPGVDINQVATENMQLFITPFYKGHHTVGVIGARAKAPIPPGQLIGISYGPGYWKNQKKPFWLFDKKGKKLALVQYGQNNQIVLAEPKDNKEVDKPEILPPEKISSVEQISASSSLLDPLLEKRIDALFPDSKKSTEEESAPREPVAHTIKQAIQEMDTNIELILQGENAKEKATATAIEELLGSFKKTLVNEKYQHITAKDFDEKSTTAVLSPSHSAENMPTLSTDQFHRKEFFNLLKTPILNLLMLNSSRPVVVSQITVQLTDNTSAEIFDIFKKGGIELWQETSCTVTRTVMRSASSSKKPISMNVGTPPSPYDKVLAALAMFLGALVGSILGALLGLAFGPGGIILGAIKGGVTGSLSVPAVIGGAVGGAIIGSGLTYHDYSRYVFFPSLKAPHPTKNLARANRHEQDDLKEDNKKINKSKFSMSFISSIAPVPTSDPYDKLTKASEKLSMAMMQQKLFTRV